jgi:uncharacterized damage-inducible protein DinB
MWVDGSLRRIPARVGARAAYHSAVAALMEPWREVEKAMRGVLANLEDADLERVVEFSPGDGPLQRMGFDELMRAGAIHGVHHRGQVALLLRSLGHSPGNLDMLGYYQRQG